MPHEIMIKLCPDGDLWVIGSTCTYHCRAGKQELSAFSKDTRVIMASGKASDLTLCGHCQNDQYEFFSQTDLGNGENLIVCLECKNVANTDLWYELLDAKGGGVIYSLDETSEASSSSARNQIRQHAVASCREIVKEIKPDEILPICFAISCNCGSSEFRNVTDEDDVSTLAHVKVCDRCENVMGVDENVLLEEVEDFIAGASFKTTECSGCGNTDPDQYTFENSAGSGFEIKCNRCSVRVDGGSAPHQDDPPPVRVIPAGTAPGRDSTDYVALVEKLTNGSAKIANTIVKSNRSGITGVICIELNSLAKQIAHLQQAKDAGQIPHGTYVDGVVESVGKSATKVLFAGVAYLLPIPSAVNLGHLLGSLFAPAGGRAAVWGKDQLQQRIKNMKL
ncbi:hypothetical protein CAPTEDRAFT_190178 [Capitella teleta]|uniref:Uncharacterized protein n=1 Tax=Capitella teleta TaxID=283909 RepID=R7UV38_CAPTE|nr:hypothetical protein CAPTEDRAFT_190178 [Capitella teleta]|eukprot:ELU07256.1 hypothetical protein CAPTEDRAFT_190178 [Capitella teleta]